MVEEGPANHVSGAFRGLMRWRCIDLVGVVRERFGVECHHDTIGRILKELGFSHISPHISPHISSRAQHPKQDEQAIEEYKNFKNLLAETTKDVKPGPPVEIWFCCAVKLHT